MRIYKAVFFDFDGVLGRTMEDNYLAWRHAFAQHDLYINKVEYFLLEGMNPRAIAEKFLKQHSLKTVSAPEIAALKEKFYMDHNAFCLYPGAERLIISLKEQGYALGLVSGGTTGRIRKTLGTDFLRNFSVVVTGDDVQCCKPDPEPYLKAAAQLSLSAGDCLVVENAPLGIESAKSAGMDCLAVCSTLPKQYLTRADAVVSNLEEIIPLLQPA